MEKIDEMKKFLKLFESASMSQDDIAARLSNLSIESDARHLMMEYPFEEAVTRMLEWHFKGADRALLAKEMQFVADNSSIDTSTGEFVESAKPVAEDYEAGHHGRRVKYKGYTAQIIGQVGTDKIRIQFDSGNTMTVGIDEVIEETAVVDAPAEDQLDEGSNTDPTVLDFNQRHAMVELTAALKKTDYGTDSNLMAVPEVREALAALLRATISRMREQQPQ